MAGNGDSEAQAPVSAALGHSVLDEAVLDGAALGGASFGGRAEAPRPREVTLGSRDLAMLAFERAWWRRGGVKEEAIREEFGISAARYYQLLGALIDTVGALQEDPMLVKRLQRLRDARAVRRADLIRVTRTS